MNADHQLSRVKILNPSPTSILEHSTEIIRLIHVTTEVSLETFEWQEDNKTLLVGSKEAKLGTKVKM